MSCDSAPPFLLCLVPSHSYLPPLPHRCPYMRLASQRPDELFPLLVDPEYHLYQGCVCRQVSLGEGIKGGVLADR